MLHESPFRISRCLLPAVMVPLSGPKAEPSNRDAKSTSVARSRPRGGTGNNEVEKRFSRTRDGFADLFCS